MAVTHSDAMKVVISTAVRDAIDAGTEGLLVFKTGGVTVATLTLATISSSSISGTGVYTFDTIASDTNAVGNASAVDNAEIQTSAGLMVLACSAGVSADISLSSATIGATDTVSISALTYTPAP